MSNVIPFHSKKQRLQKELLTLIQDLKEIYGGLDVASDATIKLETIAQDAEEDYNIVLRKYIDEVGVENVEVGYLEYTTDIAVLFDGGDVSIKFVYNPQQLSLFPEDN